MKFKELKRNLSKDFSAFKPCKIAILGDSATQFLNKAIKGYGYNEKFNFDIYEADYDQIERQIYDGESELYQFQPEFVIICASSEKLIEKFYRSHNEEKAVFADNYINKIQSLWHEINSRLNCTIINMNYVEINDNVFGNYGNKTRNSFTYQLRKLNLNLMDEAQEFKNVFISDICSLQSELGRTNTFDGKMYATSKMVLSIDFLPYVAKNVVDIIKASKGIIKKCLIMDLDNTLWGGVIGDDGINNIQIGDLGAGKAYTDLQMWAKQLKERGIILAVCSKNTEEIAKEPFIKHPDMVLKLQDIAVFAANWETKVDNIKYIQSILNIGLDSMVFIDDNPFERNMIKEMIPQITVPDLPEDPAEYVPYLRRLNLFETTSYSGEDSKRTKQYQTEAKRVEFKKSFESVNGYLESLNMISEVESFKEFYIPRIAQLTQRSNQFNFRTIRYTEEDIERMKSSDEYLTLYFTLEDKFGDNGLISVLILKKKDKETLFIDTWIMSCRVLKRGMEDFVINNLVELAKKQGYTKIIGEYIPTPKNKLVKDLYKECGFSKIETDDDGNDSWILDVNSYTKREVYIKMKH